MDTMTTIMMMTMMTMQPPPPTRPTCAEVKENVLYTERLPRAFLLHTRARVTKICRYTRLYTYIYICPAYGTRPPTVLNLYKTSLLLKNLYRSLEATAVESTWLPKTTRRRKRTVFSFRFSIFSNVSTVTLFRPRDGSLVGFFFILNDAVKFYGRAI